MPHARILPKATCLLTLLALAAGNFAPLGAADQDLPKMRAIYLEMDRIARETEADQRQAIPRCYELSSLLIPRRYANSFPPKRFPKLAGEDLADALEKAGGWASLHSAAREQCLALLRAHGKELDPLVAADFASADQARIARALDVVGELRRGDFFPQVLAVFQGKSQLSGRALYVLRDLNDPRAIEPVLKDDPQQPTRHFEILQSLCRKRAASPALVKLLDSPEASVRWQAAYALRESGDETLVPKLRKLLEDADPRVRRAASNVAVNLPDQGFAQVRESVLKLLQDPDAMVRFDTALYFARKKENAAAPTLLGLLRGGKLENGYHSTVVQSMHTLTDSYFGYELGEPPTSPANQRAVDAFAAWIEKNRAG